MGHRKGAEEEVHHRGPRIHRGQVDTVLLDDLDGPWVEGSDTRVHGGRSTRHDEVVGSDDGTDRGEENSPEGGHRDVHNNHYQEDMGDYVRMEVGIESESVRAHFSGSPLEAAKTVSSGASSQNLSMLTSAVQWTLEPLKSLLSSLSTATLRSAAVSNSTNLIFDQ